MQEFQGVSRCYSARCLDHEFGGSAGGGNQWLHTTPSQWVSSKDPKAPEFFLWLTSGSSAWKYVQLNLQRIFGVLADLSEDFYINGADRNETMGWNIDIAVSLGTSETWDTLDEHPWNSLVTIPAVCLCWPFQLDELPIQRQPVFNPPRVESIPGISVFIGVYFLQRLFGSRTPARETQNLASVWYDLQPFLSASVFVWGWIHTTTLTTTPNAVQQRLLWNKQNFQVGGMLIVFFAMLSLEAINSRPKNVINSGEKEGSNWDPPLRKGIANQDSLIYLYDSI